MNARSAQLPLTRERRATLGELEQLLGQPVQAYVWAFRKIHPGWLLFASFMTSQVINEIIIYELFEARGRYGIERTLVEIVSPLLLWFLLDTAIQFILTVAGRGHRLLVQSRDGELLVFHRRLLSARPERLERRICGSLALDAKLMGFAIDRLDTSIGRFYVWGRWRDVRLLVQPATQASHAHA
ncbi:MULTISPECIES: hypothetical protein [Pseudomonas]|uniref:Uncharacterized protein n=1 Tax=Pseudomonas fluorescens TaxID=294 RepID=A0A5E6SJ53_PSEFL|nr:MULTISPECIES: hypothetical protein [Pseudomonas]VVM80876.1 hypothetical protein PS652_02281 [Pseudomonas fluorescens]